MEVAMLVQKITDDYKQAMKDRNALKSSTLSFLRAQIKNFQIQQKNDQVNDADVLSLIKRQVKQRVDSIDQFEKGGRNDLVEKEKAELRILKSYLPEEFTDEELENIVREAISESLASSIKDMGKAMKHAVMKAAGRADGKRISECVKGMLSQM